MSPALKRRTNTDKKYERIRHEFKKRFTDQPRPKKYTREYIIALLADEFFLSMKTVEDIIYTKPATPATNAQPLKAAA